MKTFSTAVLALLAASLAGAQTLPPSPTASVGCEPHGDHWHCDGPATATGAAVTTASTHDHDDDDHSHSATGTKSLAPSPTESIGCEPHGDHWHCDGPATSSKSHADAAGTGSLPPSPTASVGCQPHGDHWHCDGPASTTASNAAISGTSSTVRPSASTTAPAAGAGSVVVNGAAIVGGLLAAVAL